MTFNITYTADDELRIVLKLIVDLSVGDCEELRPIWVEISEWQTFAACARINLK